MIKRIQVAVIYFSFLVVVACTDKVDPLGENLPQTFRISEGIEISLIAPAGFSLAHEFYGFSQVASFSRIQVTEKEYPFDAYIKSLTKENLIKNKFQLLKHEQIDVSGSLCTLLTLRQNIAGTYFEQLWLIAGDKLSSVQVEASYPEGANKKHKQAIKQSILTLSVASDDSKRLFTGLPFSLSSLPHFKVKRRFLNSVVLLPISRDDAGQVLVLSHGAVKEPVDSIQELSDHFIKTGKLYENVQIINNEMIKLANIPALMTTASAEIDGEKTWVYQVLSYQKERFFLLHASSPYVDHAELLEQITELLEGFQFR